jgi:hypothetical protein
MWFQADLGPTESRGKGCQLGLSVSQNFACTFSEKAKSSFTTSQSSFFCYLSNLLPSPLVPSLCDIKLVKILKKTGKPSKNYCRHSDGVLSKFSSTTTSPFPIASFVLVL